MGLESFKRVVKRHPFMVSRKLRKQYTEEIKLLKRSKLFNRRFYLTKHPDVAEDKFWRKNPILHYLIVGGEERRQCSVQFDTNWYVEHNEDVMQEGVNPLVHYLQYGQREGRRISGRKYSGETRDTREVLRNSVIKHMWGGYSEQGLKDLARYYEDSKQPKELRYFTAWHAARWYFYVQDLDKVLSLAELIKSLDPTYEHEKNTAMMFAYAYLSKNQTDKARDVATAFLSRHPQDTDMLLTLANTLADEDEKLDIVNRIYRIRDLNTIEKRDNTAPLSFANITGRSEPIRHEKKVSVVMPTFNADDKIAAALTSILEQSWKNLEIVVVDDCSTDDTVKVAQSVADKDSRVRVFSQPKNGGAYLARNRGLKEATGDFITTHDSDDWSHPDKIATQVELLLRKDEMMGVCLHWTRALDNLTFTHNWNLNERLVHWNHSSFLFRREVLDEIGPWDKVVVGGDTEFIWRAQARYGKAAVIKYKPNIPFSFALDDDASLTRTKATHVSTIHNGLRHLYRSGAKWWHEQAEKPVIAAGDMAFPAPKPMRKRGDVKHECDELFIADFSKEFAFKCLGEHIQRAQQEGKKTALLHWPEYGTEKEDLMPAFFSLLLDEHCEPIVYGMEVTCDTVTASHAELFSVEMEKMPVVNASRLTVVKNQHQYDGIDVMQALKNGLSGL